MRYQRFKYFLVIIFFLYGVLTIPIAFFALQFHLDNNNIMGPGRKLLAFSGFFAILAALLILFGQRLRTSRCCQQVSDSFKSFMQSLAESRFGLWFKSIHSKYRTSTFHLWLEKHTWIWPTLAAIIVIFLYFFYFTDGKWFWTPLSNYFDLLANAFLKGSLALLEKPPSALAALTNPYDYTNREGIRYLWDATYYHGNYYLYWGPVPALLAAAIKVFFSSTIEDQQLTFLFLSGLAIVLAALLHRLRSAFFPSAPPWTTCFFTLVAMLSLPLLWIVNRAMVYEAAIASAQFFLILGLFAAIQAMLSRHKSTWLLLAGFSWGAAVNSRVNIAAAVAWFSLLTLIFILTSLKKPSRWIRPALALILPLLLCAFAFATYNYARFGSILETGHRYQLTGLGLPEEYSKVASLQYIIPNLYNYLARSFQFTPQHFPFVKVPYITDAMWPWYIPRPPGTYAAKQISGIFRTIPFFWFLLLPLLKVGSMILAWAKKEPLPQTPGDPALKWTWWMLAGSAFFLTSAISIFIAANMRYLVDVIPILVLLTAMCIWWGLLFLKRSRFWQWLLLMSVVLLGLAGISIGLLSGFAVPPFRFRDINPGLYKEIASFFRFLSQ